MRDTIEQRSREVIAATEAAIRAGEEALAAGRAKWEAAGGDQRAAEIFATMSPEARQRAQADLDEWMARETGGAGHADAGAPKKPRPPRMVV